MQTISFLFLQEEQLQSSEREYQLQIRQKVKLSCDYVCIIHLCLVIAGGTVDEKGSRAD